VHKRVSGTNKGLKGTLGNKTKWTETGEKKEGAPTRGVLEEWGESSATSKTRVTGSERIISERPLSMEKFESHHKEV